MQGEREITGTAAGITGKVVRKGKLKYNNGQKKTEGDGSMKQAARQIAVCAIGLILLCLLCRLTLFSGYTAYIDRESMYGYRLEELSLAVEDGSAALLGPAEVTGERLRFSVIPEREGEIWVAVRGPDGRTVTYRLFRVGRFLTVYDMNTGSFTGDTAVLIAVTVFWLLVTLIMVRQFLLAKGPAFYSYRTVYFSGFSIFSFFTFAMMLTVTLRRLISPEQFQMLSAYSAIRSASSRFMKLTALPVLAFAGAMAASNLMLLRHATPRVRNVLGLLIALLILGGEAAGFWLYSRDIAGSEMEIRLWNTLENVYATAFVYFECILTGAVICGVLAARHEPTPDRDFIVILGCWFRKDGSLPPLLRGRVDRAIAFWRKQKELTGKEAVLIPSGGQGPDEPMPEAEAMKRYLLEQGIPEERIRTEDQSRNTLQNMAYSRKIAEEIDPRGKAAFATTNYHVFRSGVWAGEAGLKAEGMGGKTKWWYWPNAFMRECLGLLQKRWMQELIGLILLAAFFGALSMALL